jgi:hypothetical protein
MRGNGAGEGAIYDQHQARLSADRASRLAINAASKHRENRLLSKSPARLEQAFYRHAEGQDLANNAARDVLKEREPVEDRQNMARIAGSSRKNTVAIRNIDKASTQRSQQVERNRTPQPFKRQRESSFAEWSSQHADRKALYMAYRKALSKDQKRRLFETGVQLHENTGYNPNNKGKDPRTLRRTNQQSEDNFIQEFNQVLQNPNGGDFLQHVDEVNNFGEKIRNIANRKLRNQQDRDHQGE